MTWRVWTGLAAILATSTPTPRLIQAEQQAATVLWESALAAKGGRDRLTAVRSFAIRETGTFKHPVRGVASGVVDQIVCALPHGWWEFADYRPGEMGYSVRVADAAAGSGWASSGGAPPAPFRRPDTFIGFRMRLLQVVYFLETSAVRPKPVSASRVKLRSRAIDRVVVRIDDDPVTVYLDATTHLPLRIEAIYRTTLPPPRPDVRPSGGVTYRQDLEHYTDIGGLRLPSAIRRGDDRFDVHIEVNPDYDPSIFTGPPAPDSGIDAWRRRPPGATAAQG